MRASDLRRLESVERSLDSSSIDALEPFTPTQLVEAWRNRTATPLHMRQIYEIRKRDMEIKALQEGIKRRVDLDFGRGREIVWPFDVLAELLRYRSDQDPGFNLEWRPYDPDNPTTKNCFGVQSVRYPDTELYLSMALIALISEKVDICGHLWTSRDAARIVCHRMRLS